MASQPFDINRNHDAPRTLDKGLQEFWLKNPFDFEGVGGFNLSRFERNRMFFGVGQGRFRDVSFVSATDLDSDTRNVAVGDVTGDQRPDLFVRSVGGGPLRVFRNAMDRADGLAIHLRGSRGHASGIGARLWLEQDGVLQYREYFPQNTLFAQDAREVIFGLKTDGPPATLRIRWPSGQEQRIEGLTPGRRTITETP